MFIKRRHFLQNSTLGGLALLANPLFFINKTFQSESGFKEIRKGVGYFIGKGGTMGWMVTKDGLVAVDSQFPTQASEFIKEIQGKTDRKFDSLINTHHHRDHTSGNIAFKNLTSEVVAHDNARRNQKRVAQEKGIESEQLYPNETFATQWTKRFDKETIQANYYGPAHTNGDIIIHFENANIAHMGDLVFNRRYPNIDKSSGANIENWIKVLDNALDYFDADTKFIFGHADNGYSITGNKDDILSFQGYLDNLLKYMDVQMKSGKDLDSILKDTEGIPGASEWKGDGIERSIKAAFEEFNS